MPHSPQENEASADETALGQPHSAGLPVQCQFCVGREFRRSRLRKADIKQIFYLRYPVRCLRCSQRQMVSFSVAGLSLPAHAKHVHGRRVEPSGERPPASTQG